MSKLKIIQVSVDSIKPWDKNPRFNEDAVEPVAKSIEEFGFNVPILINEDGQIIAGHTRLLAAQKLGMKEVPAIRLEHLTPDQQKAFNIADNKTAQYARWNDDLLKEIFTELQTSGYDVAQTGFGGEEIDNIMNGWKSDIDAMNSIEESDDVAPGRIVIKCQQQDEAELRDYIELKLKEVSFTGVKIE